MAYTEVASLDADTVVSLGGVNRKTNKKNPTQVEGYFLGSKTVKDNKKKGGEGCIHIFKTAKGNIGVWAKTDMDRKLAGATPGAMTRITFDKMRPTPNGDMYVYKVEVDNDNVIDVGGLSASNDSSDDDYDAAQPTTRAVDPFYGNDGEDNEGEAEEVEEEDEQTYEAPTPRATSNPAQKARVEALLKKSKGA